MDSFDRAVDIAAGLEPLLDRADRVQDGGVIALEGASDLGQRGAGLVAGDVDRDLAGADEVGGAAGELRSARETRRTSQVASWTWAIEGRLGSAGRLVAVPVAESGEASACLTISALAGTPSSEAKAATLVSAPSSRLRLAGTA